MHEYSVSTQSCRNVVVRLQRCTTNAQRCSNVDVTTLILQRCSNVASMLGSKFNPQCNMNIVLTTLLQPLPTLYQICGLFMATWKHHLLYRSHTLNVSQNCIQSVKRYQE